MCDHFSIDCFCENEYIVLKGEPQKPKVAKKAIDPIAHHASTMRCIEELELVQVVHGDGTSFVVPEHVVRAEGLHEIGEEAKSRSRGEQVTDESEHEDPTVGSLEGDLSGARQPKHSLMLEMDITDDALALVPVDDSQSSLFDETKKTANEILKEDLHNEAIVVADEDQKDKAIFESQQSSDEATLIDEKMIQAIREAVVETMQSVAAQKMDQAADKMKYEESPGQIASKEQKDKIASEDVSDMASVQLSKTPEEIILAPIIDDEPSRDQCAACSQRVSQKLKFSMTQDPTVSLEGMKQLCDQFDEARIHQDMNEIVQIMQNEMDFIATKLNQDLDQVIGPLVCPAAQVVDVIIKGLIEDGIKLADAFNQVVEHVSDTTVDWVIDMADFAVGCTANTVDAIICAKDIMATQGKSIASILFFGSEANSSTSSEEDLLSPNLINEEEETNIESCIDSMPSGLQKQTPLRWLARGLRNMLAPTKQSASIYLTQWPACSGLSEWPVSGRPGSQRPHGKPEADERRHEQA